MKDYIKPIIAFFICTFLWSSSVVVTKEISHLIPPMLFMFLRLLIASVLFFPYIIYQKTWKKAHLGKLVLASLAVAVNFIFFMWGIQYTSAPTSQIIYAAVPIVVVLIDSFILKHKHPMHKIIGVLIGLFGIGIIIYQSAVNRIPSIVGSPAGNLAIVIGMLSWVYFLFASKQISQFFSPLEIGSITIFVTFLLSVLLAFCEFWLFGKTVELNNNLIFPLLYIGIFGTFLTYFLYQYAIKNLSSLTVSLSSYIQPIITTLLAIIILGDVITPGFVSGSVLVFSGIFMIFFLEIHHRRRS